MECGTHHRADTPDAALKTECPTPSSSGTGNPKRWATFFFPAPPPVTSSNKGGQNVGTVPELRLDEVSRTDVIWLINLI